VAGYLGGSGPPGRVGARGTSLPPMWRVSRAGSSPRRGSGGVVGRRRGRRLARSVPRTAWLVGRGSGVAGCLGGGGPPGVCWGSWHEFAAYMAGFSCRQRSAAGARAGLSASAGGVGSCAPCRARLGLYGGGAGGVAGNVGRTGPAHGDPDVVLARRGRQRRDRGGGARDSRRYRRSRRAGRLHPSPVPADAVTANRTAADCDGAADRPRRRATNGADGVGVRRQRRMNRRAAAGLRRYRRISTATSHRTCERGIRATLP
jgi:hypothetical protein